MRLEVLAPTKEKEAGAAGSSDPIIRKECPREQETRQHTGMCRRQGVKMGVRQAEVRQEGEREVQNSQEDEA